MPRLIASIVVAALVGAATARATVTPKVAQDLYDSVTPSLVAVQYVWQNELGRRELTGAGIVVSGDGLVMAPMLPMFNPSIPDEQMKEFKILVPRENDEPQELEAVFQGRDERTNMAFVKTREPQKWKPIKFEETKVNVGETILSVGMLPKGANYKTYFTESAVAALLRGEVPQVLVMGAGLAASGSPVFTEGGKAVGIVMNNGQTMLLDDPRDQGQLTATILPPKIYVPARYFEISLQDPPTPNKPLALPWMGVPRWTGVTKDVAEVYGLGNQPAVQVGDVIADTPADKAGLKPGDIIVKVNGKPLERGDEPAELPLILGRNLLRMHVGDTVTFSVLRDKDQPLVEIPIKLGDRPKQANLAKRFFADDLGFAVRDVVFYDTYAMHLPSDTKGVIVALLRPQSAAQSGGLLHNDLITRLNNEPVVDVDQFQKAYNDLRKSKPKEAIVLEVHRQNRENTIRIEPPQ